jgi:hypothetical protein
MKNNQFKNKIKILNKSKTAFKLQKEVQFKGY